MSPTARMPSSRDRSPAMIDALALARRHNQRLDAERARLNLRIAQHVPWPFDAKRGKMPYLPGGAWARQLSTESTMAVTGSSIASRKRPSSGPSGTGSSPIAADNAR